MSKAYVVVEQDFEEFSPPVGETQGQPRAVFVDQRQAEACAKRFNAQKYAGSRLALGDYEFKDVCDLSEAGVIQRLNAILEEPFFREWFELYEKPLPEDLPLPILKEIAALFKYKFFYVVEFDVIE